MTEVSWWRSPWDERLHAYQEVGEVIAEAMCSHSSLASHLTEPTGETRTCMGCQLLVGDLLADERGGDATWRG